MNPFEFYGQDYIPGILTDSECLELKDHLHKKFDKLPCISDPGRGMVKMIYRPEEAETVQDRVRYFLERYLQAPLYPTYWFSTQYYNRSYMAAHTKKLGEVRHSEALLAGVFGVYRVDYGAHVDVRSHRRRKGLWRVQLG